MAYEEHLHAGANQIIRAAVLTLSDTRDETTDTSGQKIKTLLTDAGHQISHYSVLPDERNRLRAALASLLADVSIDVILTNGGTGISRRDQTIDVIEFFIEHGLPGFGELFRMLSWQQIGSGAMLSRALGGIANGKPIFAMPGSTKAVELAMTKLVLPELGHLLSELKK